MARPRGTQPVDKVFLYTSIALIGLGFLIFISASLGFVTRHAHEFSSIITNQLVLGLVMGSISAYLLSHVDMQTFRKYSFYIFIVAAILSLAVFIPGIGFAFGGAHRWIHVGPLSFQPAELLKIAYILYIGAWLAGLQKKIGTFKHGLLPWMIVSGIAAFVLLIQPDTDTTVVMIFSGAVMYFVAGAKWKHIGLVCLAGLLALSLIVAVRPYVRDRIMTFINPAADPLESGYQIQQSLIAIGSGGVTGRGFGQSIQKFNFLPEPIGDSIFAVYAEEFGFLGALILLGLFTTFMIRGYRIAARSKSLYGSLVVVGLITMIMTQAFINIASMLGIIPLSGLPLMFVSHGGTALFFSLSAVGIILGFSRKS